MANTPIGKLFSPLSAGIETVGIPKNVQIRFESGISGVVSPIGASSAVERVSRIS